MNKSYILSLDEQNRFFGKSPDVQSTRVKIAEKLSLLLSGNVELSCKKWVIGGATTWNSKVTAAKSAFYNLYWN